MPLQAGFFGKERSRADSYPANSTEIAAARSKNRATRCEQRCHTASAIALPVALAVKDDVFHAVVVNPEDDALARECIADGDDGCEGRLAPRFEAYDRCAADAGSLGEIASPPGKSTSGSSAHRGGNQLLFHAPTAFIFPLAFRLVAVHYAPQKIQYGLTLSAETSIG